MIKRKNDTQSKLFFEGLEVEIEDSMKIRKIQLGWS